MEWTTKRRHLNEGWQTGKTRGSEKRFICPRFSRRLPITGDIPQRRQYHQTPSYHNGSHVHKRRTSGEVDKIERGVHVRRPGHLLVGLLEIGSGSTHRESELSTGIRTREGFRFRRCDGAENLWPVSDLEPGNLTIGAVVGLDQGLRRMDLCVIVGLKRENALLPGSEA